jgi:integrase
MVSSEKAGFSKVFPASQGNGQGWIRTSEGVSQRIYSLLFFDSMLVRRTVGGQLNMTRAKIAGLPSGVGINRTANGRGRRFWRVRLGKRFTGGRVVKKDFSSLEAARSWINGDGGSKRARAGSIVALKRNAGSAAFELTSAQLAEAAAAAQTLAGFGTITDAVAFYIKHAKPADGDRALVDAVDELLRSKRAANRGERHCRALGWNLGRFAGDFATRKLHQIKREDIERWLERQSFSAATRRNYIRDMTILFRFAFNRGWIAAIPTAGIEKANIAPEEIIVLTVDETAEFLSAAEHLSKKIAVALAIKFFAGLRTSELFKADWSDIRDGQIIVRGLHAKTRQRRTVSVPDNLSDWFSAYGSKTGPISDFQNNAWHRAIQKVVAVVQERRRRMAVADYRFCFPPNVARHSFCSYHFALHRNENLTAAEAGNTPEIIFRNYRATVHPAAAKRYWEVRPT